MRAAISIAIMTLLVGTGHADDPKPTATPVPKTAPGVTPVESAPPEPIKPDKPEQTGAVSNDPFSEYTGTNQAARRLFEDATLMARGGDIAGGCRKLADAYKLEEATTTLLNLASCRENEGKPGEARRLFLDAAQRSRTTGFEDRAKLATDRAAALEPKLATIVIRLATPIAPGTVVTVNDRLVDTAPEVRELVDPGTIVVVAKGPTGVTSTKSFRIFIGNTFKVDVPTLQEREGGRQPIFIGISAVAVGGGAIALGAGSGAVRLVGGVAIAGGIALFLLAPRQRTTVVPMLITNESGGSVALGFQF